MVVAKISDATVIRMTRANNGVFEPEMRLPACIFFACLFFFHINLLFVFLLIHNSIHSHNILLVRLERRQSSPLDCSHNRSHTLWLRHDGYLHPDPDLCYRLFP